jgi:hypothetical protein
MGTVKRHVFVTEGTVSVLYFQLFILNNKVIMHAKQNHFIVLYYFSDARNT